MNYLRCALLSDCTIHVIELQTVAFNIVPINDLFYDKQIYILYRFHFSAVNMLLFKQKSLFFGICLCWCSHSVDFAGCLWNPPWFSPSHKNQPERTIPTCVCQNARARFSETDDD